MRTHTGTDLVTGTNGYTGSYVSQTLLGAGRTVRTLTRSPASVRPAIRAYRYDFDDPGSLTRAFADVDTFYNTYWVRFGRGGTTHADAVRNSLVLIDAAAGAGVSSIVHVSIMNPDLDSPYSYQRGKAVVEQAVRNSGMRYAIVRPSVLFGGEEILLNNVAWLLRNLHVFAVPGDGSYPVRPTHVRDLADAMVRLGGSDESSVQDAGGPEMFEFGELVRKIRQGIGATAVVREAPACLVRPMAALVGRLTGDVTIHPEEMGALMDGLASCDGPSIGDRAFSRFLDDHGKRYGLRYASEVGRNFSTRS